MPRRLGLVTYPEAPDLTTDDQLLLAPLKANGFIPFPLIWSDTEPASIDADLLVIRSTWDYFLDPDRFLRWLAGVEQSGMRVINSPSTLRWNMRKDYLIRLFESGVIIPSTIVCHTWHSTIMDSFVGRPVVVKPLISAGAFNTHRFLSWTADEIEQHIRPSQSQGPILIQEYLPEIETEGEWSFVFIGRSYSHAVTKTVAPLDFRVQEAHGGTLASRTPDPDIVSQVSSILERIPDELLYARIDGVVRKGTFMLMELELFEPSLYLSFHPPAADAFASTLVRMTANDGHNS